MKTTLGEIKKHSPHGQGETDEHGWRRLCKYLGTSKLSTVVTLEQILESNGLDDAIWALRAFPENEREARLFTCACACRVSHLNPDVRVRRTIETAALFADGLADGQELAAAGAAARAGDAARAAERSWQLEELLRLCRGEGIYAPLGGE